AAPAKKAAAKPAARPAATAKSSASPAAKPARPAGKPAAPVAKPKQATTPVAPAVATSVPKPATKPAPAKSVPAKAATPAAAPVSKPVAAKPAAPSAPSHKNPVSVSKSSAKTPTKSESTPKPPVAKPTGKVAVAVTAKSNTPAKPAKFKVVDYKIDEATGRPILPKGYKPASDEEYMSTLQQEYFRQRLLNWRADLVEESKQTIENLRDEVRDIGDEAERATRETENSLELRTRDRYRKLIGKIDSTLKRLDAGDYGYCVDTGEEIGLERLEARLTAERTIDAQERWEHLQKQQGD
ncbi:RNA polymerase-binding protein DksA, partial [Xanthomonas graminis]